MVTGSDLIVLAPWILFGAAVGAIGARLWTGRSRARRRRALRHPARLGHGGGDSRGGHPREPAKDGEDRMPSPSRPGAAS